MSILYRLLTIVDTINVIPERFQYAKCWRKAALRAIREVQPYMGDIGHAVVAMAEKYCRGEATSRELWRTAWDIHLVLGPVSKWTPLEWANETAWCLGIDNDWWSLLAVLKNRDNTLKVVRALKAA